MKKRNNMNVQYDGIGFVNNRGTSKYWGVCKALHDDKNYRITFNDSKMTYTFHTDRDLGRITEQTAAKLAASLYKYRFGNLPAFINVELDDGKIYRLDSVMKKIYLLSGRAGLVIEDPVNDQQVSVLTADPKKYLGQMMDKYSISKSERQFINEVFDKTTGDDLSYRGQMMLKAVLKSTL